MRLLYAKHRDYRQSPRTSPASAASPRLCNHHLNRMRKPPADILNPRSPQEPRELQWWAGFLTLFLILAIATGLSWALQAALHATRTLDPRAPYLALYALNFIGLTAGALAESNGHGLIYDLHRTGQTVAFITNAAFYAVLIFIWLKFHGDDRLKK